MRRPANDVVGAIVTTLYGVSILCFGHHGFTSDNYRLAFDLMPAHAWGGIFVGIGLLALTLITYARTRYAATAVAALIALWCVWELMAIVSIVIEWSDTSPDDHVSVGTPIVVAGLITMMWRSLVRVGVSRRHR